MKKGFICALMAVVCLSCLLLTNCTKNAPITPENVFGTWVCTYMEEHYMEHGKMDYEVEDNIFLRMILNQDYTYQFYANSESVTYSGQWALSGNNVSFTYNGSVGKGTVQSLTSKKLVLRIDSYYDTDYELYYFDRQ